MTLRFPRPEPYTAADWERRVAVEALGYPYGEIAVLENAWERYRDAALNLRPEAWRALRYATRKELPTPLFLSDEDDALFTDDEELGAPSLNDLRDSWDGPPSWLRRVVTSLDRWALQAEFVVEHGIVVICDCGAAYGEAGPEGEPLGVDAAPCGLGVPVDVEIALVRMAPCDGCARPMALVTLRRGGDP